MNPTKKPEHAIGSIADGSASWKKHYANVCIDSCLPVSLHVTPRDGDKAYMHCIIGERRT